MPPSCSDHCYLINISSTNIHGSPPAPRCHDGILPKLYARIRTYRPRDGVTFCRYSRTVGVISVCENPGLISATLTKFVPSPDTSNSTRSGIHIHGAATCKKLPPTSEIGVSRCKSTTASYVFPCTPCHSPEAKFT